MMDRVKEIEAFGEMLNKQLKDMPKDYKFEFAGDPFGNTIREHGSAYFKIKIIPNDQTFDKA